MQHTTAAKPFTLPTSNQFINDLQNQNVLKRWNQQFPPTNYEIARQEYVTFKQNSRIPFIDIPNWACYIDFSTMKYNPTGECFKNNVSANPLRKSINLAVSPNPSANQTTVDLTAFNGEAVTMEIIDITGNLIWEGKANDKSTIINLEAFASGAYLLYVHNTKAHGMVKLMKP